MTPDDDKCLEWVFDVHKEANAALAVVMQADSASSTAEADSGLWWAVLNVESPDFNPESLWSEKNDAQSRADNLNTGRYQSWQVMPAAVAWWMRNEYVPDVLVQTADVTTRPNVCEHGDHTAPAGQRFCSAACERCEHESMDPEDEGCSGLCGLDSEGQPADVKVTP